MPGINSTTMTEISNPSNPPENLVTLSENITKSVVKIICGQGSGSGWSIKFDHQPTQGFSNFGSYLITNHHVIANCINGQVDVLLSDGRTIKGTVYAWDDENDLASIVVSEKIPQLKWQGGVPKQGTWAGVIGSPLGIRGVLTTGIVSLVNLESIIGTTTAPINPGNSGGPIFDRDGRVFGIASAKFSNSEGFGIFRGTPQLCLSIINCELSSNIWSGIYEIKQKEKNPLTLPENGATFTASNSKMLACGTAPVYSSEFISKYKISGAIIKIFDLTANLEVDNTKVQLTDLPPEKGIRVEMANGQTLSYRVPNSDSYWFGYYFKSQIKDHQYQCSVAILANETVGEFIFVYSNAKFSGKDYKVVENTVLEDSPPTPITPSNKGTKKTIICQKGSSLRKVIAINPKCPKGYKKKYSI